MPVLELEFPLGRRTAETVEAALFECGAVSVAFFDRADDPVLEPLPGEVRLWRDTLVRSLFPADADPIASLARLGALIDPGLAAEASWRAVADRAWEREWLNDWHAMRFGARLWVCPTTADPPADPDAVVMQLDPGLAFGTGTHPTTAMCLEALAELDLAGRSVLDFGCGSGILAIAALKLGAIRALCVDIDPQALLATRTNAAANGVAERLATADAAFDSGGFDVVLANILAAPLIDNSARLTAACRPGGTLLLSGILETQEQRVIEAYQPGFAMVKAVRREDWSCLQARRRIAGHDAAE